MTRMDRKRARERARVETDSPAGCNTLFIKGTVVPSGDGETGHPSPVRRSGRRKTRLKNHYFPNQFYPLVYEKTFYSR